MLCFRSCNIHTPTPDLLYNSDKRCDTSVGAHRLGLISYFREFLYWLAVSLHFKFYYRSERAMHWTGIGRIYVNSIFLLLTLGSCQMFHSTYILYYVHCSGNCNEFYKRNILIYIICLMWIKFHYMVRWDNTKSKLKCLSIAGCLGSKEYLRSYLLKV